MGSHLVAAAGFAEDAEVPSPPVAMVFRASESGANCFTFSPDGTKIVTAGWTGPKDDFESWQNGTTSGEMRIWDVATGKELGQFRGEMGAVFDVGFSPDGNQIFTAGRVLNAADRGIVTVWDARSRQPVRTMLGHTRWVLRISVSPDGRQIASGSFDRSVRIWDTATGNKVDVLKVLSTPARLAFGPDGATLMACCRGGEVVFWDANTWKVRHSVANAGTYLMGSDLSRDGKRIAIVGTKRDPDGTVRFQDPGILRVHSAEDGSEIAAWSTKSSSSDVAFSPDGRHLVEAGAGYVSVWDIQVQKESFRFERGTSTSEDRVRFSPDGKTIAISASSTVTLLDVGGLLKMGETKE